MIRLVVIALLAAGCVGPGPYQRVTNEWTRKVRLSANYQEVLSLAAVYKSVAWRTAHAEKDAKSRGLTGPAYEQRIAQAKADAAGPIEIELLVTTWDRRENDLDRGERSVWRVRLLDDAGAEIKPLELIKDKRPLLVVRAEFPAMGDFATAYIVRFERKELRNLRLRVSSERGGVQVEWPVL
jgi:hypothetical protein